MSIENLLRENERVINEARVALEEADNLLACALVFVEDMVGVASAARGLPEEIIAWRNKYGKTK